ncbi:hypothetical protein C6A85_71145, partial [Mycobacterium sp. ITM-2017-0098]
AVSLEPTRPASVECRAKWSRSAWRPRWIRLRTVPSLTPSVAPEFRAAVVLCDIEGLSYEEIGASESNAACRSAPRRES